MHRSPDVITEIMVTRLRCARHTQRMDEIEIRVTRLRWADISKEWTRVKL